MRAREDQADTLAQEVVDILDDVARKPNATAIDVRAALNRADARKWFAGKVRPKVWGDRNDPEPPAPLNAAAILAEIANGIPD